MLGFVSSAVTFAEANQPEDTSYRTQAYGRAFVSYRQNSYFANDTYRMIAYQRADNSADPYTEMALAAAVSQSGMVSAQITTGIPVGAEIDAIVAQVSAGTSVAASASVSYTAGQTFSGGTSVPPGKTGELYVYIIIGISSNGVGAYKAMNMTSGDWRYEERALGGIVPAYNQYNDRTAILDPV